MKQIITKSRTVMDVVIGLDRQYPTYERDLSIGQEIQGAGILRNNPKAARTMELLGDLDHLVA